MYNLIIFFRFYAVTEQNMTFPPQIIQLFPYLFWFVVILNFCQVPSNASLLHRTLCCVRLYLLGHWERCTIMEGHTVMQSTWGRGQETMTQPWDPDAMLYLWTLLSSFLISKRTIVTALLTKQAASALMYCRSMKPEIGGFLRGWWRFKFVGGLNSALGFWPQSYFSFYLSLHFAEDLSCSFRPLSCMEGLYWKSS